MRVRFHKLSEEQHRLEVIRADGSRDERLLESRSLLLHDFVHYAVESEWPLPDAFYGCLARGVTFARLAETTFPAPSDELAQAESLVGPMQSVVNGRASAALLGPMPDGFVSRSLERVRRLRGLWRATPWRSVMEVEWPAPPLDPSDAC